MAKKKDPDQIDKVIAELTCNTTAAELINDPSVLRELKKRQVRLPGFDEKVLSLNATGLTTRQIEASLQEIYGVEVSPALISKVAGDGHVAGCRCPLAWSPPAHTPRCRLDTPRTSSNRRLRSHPPPG
jgi:hypothetical protein